MAAAVLSYGKRCLKAAVEQGFGEKKKRKLTSSVEDCEYWVNCGLDKSGLVVKYISDYKGFGVFSTQHFRKGDFLLEYVGERILEKDAAERFKKNTNMLFYYKFNGEKHCIDASSTTGHICQYVNDGGKKEMNCKMRLVVVKNIPRLCLFATKDIICNEELLYDYGDCDKYLWWRKKVNSSEPMGCLFMIEKFGKFYISNVNVPNIIHDYNIINNLQEAAKGSKINLEDDDDDDDDDPFDITKISDISSEEVSDSCSDSLLSAIVPYKMGKRVEKQAITELEDLESEQVDEHTITESEDLESEQVEEHTITELEYLESEQVEEHTITELEYLESEQVEKQAITELEDLESEQVEKQAITELEDLESEQVEEHTITELEYLESEQVEKQAITELEDLESEQVEEHTITELEYLESEQVEKQAITELEDLESEQVEEHTITELEDLESEQKTSEMVQKNCEKNKKKLIKERPGRMCIFCDKVIIGGKLKRHIKTHKKTHEEIASILKRPLAEQTKWFEEKRHEGMYRYNMLHLDDDDECKLMRERKPKTTDELRMCLKCKRFFSNRTFYKHKDSCNVEADPIKTKSLKPLVIHKDSDFVINILNKFRDNEVGTFIRGSKIIQVIGYKHYQERKADSSKVNEIKREVMMEIRELSRLFLCFQSLSDTDVEFEDMYTREHLSTLEEAFNKLCKTEDGEKYGLKVNLNSIFQRSSKILSGYFSESKFDMQMKELEKFRKAYNSKLPELIGKAKHKTEKNSLKKARLPKNLPIENDITKLHTYLKAEIDFIVKNFSINNYTFLRSLIVARLTLFNARRGEEGSRLLLEEWTDAEKGTWIPPDNIEKLEDEGERFLLGQFKLAYLAGKGRKSVPLLIPNDLVEAIRLLISNRSTFGIASSNNFVFATKSSKFHCSGWHAVDFACELAGVSVNATRNRHRASTVYASLDMTEKDRRIFFEHLGHSENVNKENYQCPPGLNEVTVMGQFLNSLEGDSTSALTKSTASQETVSSPVDSNKRKQIREGDSTSALTKSTASQETVSSPVDSNKQKQIREGDSTLALTKSTASQETVSSPVDSNKQKQIREGSFRWTCNNTEKIKKDFQGWIQIQIGNKLPSKKYLEEYLAANNDIGCTLKQLRNKLMNEQNKKRKIKSQKLLKLQNF